MDAKQSEVGLGEIIGVLHTCFLAAEWAADDRVVPQLDDAFLAEGVAALAQDFG